MLKNLLIYLAVIAVSGGLAWYLFRDTAPKDDPVPEEDSLPTIENPIWYRGAGPELRIAAIRKRLPLMTSMSIPPEQAGPVKDEIALLCAFHEDCVDEVVDYVKKSSLRNSAEVSAFMEIFTRVRNPKFGELLAIGIDHQRWEARYNAAEAAVTQGDPRAVEILTAALMEQEGLEVQSVIEALVRIGGDAGYGALAYGLQRNEANILKSILVALGTVGYRPALPDIRALLNGQDIEVRVVAAWALANMGQQQGVERLLTYLRDETLPGPVRALAATYLAGTTAIEGEVAEAMRGLLEADDRALRFESSVALISTDDEELAGAHGRAARFRVRRGAALRDRRARRHRS